MMTLHEEIKDEDGGRRTKSLKTRESAKYYEWTEI